MSAADQPLGRTVLETRELHRSFGKKPAVNGVSFTVEQGELFGLVGPDGAGKTTTISCLAGLMRPTRGEVLVLGSDPMARDSSVREKLGLMPQDYSLYGDLTIAENMRFFGRLFGIPRADFERREEHLLHITRLGRFTERRADALSGGMYKKLALSCALLHRPDVLLLDEPTNGVDPVSRRELWALIGEFVADGMTVLISTPYMDEAARCHRVAMMHEGQVIAMGSPADLTDSLRNEVVVALGGDRAVLHPLLARHASVIAASPAGAQLRIVLAENGRAALEAELPNDVRLETVPPDFEDVFLAKVAV